MVYWLFSFPFGSLKESFVSIDLDSYVIQIWLVFFNVFNELSPCHVSLQSHDASDKQATDNLEKQVEDLNKQVALVC